jgi:hypothetical protein
MFGAAALALIAGATPAAAQSCLESAGRAKSAEYVRHCREVSPATRPPCNAANSCALIIGEIERGCRMFADAERPKLCAAYRFDRR